MSFKAHISGTSIYVPRDKFVQNYLCFCFMEDKQCERHNHVCSPEVFTVILIYDIYIITTMLWRAIEVTFSHKCPCIRIMIQNFLTLRRKRLVLTFLVKFITVELLNHKSIKACRFCHLLPAILIQLLYHMQNDGLAIWENKFSPLRGGVKRQRKHMRGKANAGWNHLFSELQDHGIHHSTQPGQTELQNLTATKKKPKNLHSRRVKNLKQ